MAGQDLQTLIEAPHRRPANIARNAARHPVETLEFFGLAPDMTVLEILPAFGWYTEILAPYLADEGLLYVAHFSPDGILPYMPQALEMYEKISRRNPAIYGKVTVRHINPPHEVSVAPPGSVDLALTFRNVHNWIMSDQEDEYFKAFYQAVKPGGVLGVVEHRAKPGASMDSMHKTGYVTEDYVKEVATTAGFEFEDASEINANPQDTTDHPKGVWSLPPILQSGGEEPYRSIGESDRMTLKFRKPA
ncbi:MAG: methyltransferase [Gammaproteobacteria bacterium]|uniref:Methyltransferase n=1 Tax=OM182 bacterium MED-G24 TaxID=1986255 RepID=A0A2A5WKZ0_9GAMM|nr:methyltransferase [Gammaproteobacteria bacterium]PDH36963.1 MAG: methyltransferase [OM182 bacterium MED-G24]|tara:strand:+ start:1671 stop:2411 length:741 start_codon:yes stop_codon:yes gene_type:complete